MSPKCPDYFNSFRNLRPQTTQGRCNLKVHDFILFNKLKYWKHQLSYSLLSFTWVSASSGSWRWAGRPGVLQSMGSQRVGQNWATGLNFSASPLLHINWIQLWIIHDASGAYQDTYSHLLPMSSILFLSTTLKNKYIFCTPHLQLDFRENLLFSHSHLGATQYLMASSMVQRVFLLWNPFK